MFKLRIEFFGPGVMTDNERAQAKKILGDPNAFWTTDAREKAKINITAEASQNAKHYAHAGKKRRKRAAFYRLGTIKIVREFRKDDF